jgi:SAM-dependent methyltransferase
MDSRAWDERYAAEPLVWSSGPNQFVATLESLPPGRALDLACGEGRNAIWLASLGWSVTGVDFSAVAIDKARTLSRDVEWVVGDVLTFEGSGYDLAVLAYLQVSADDRRAAVRRAWDCLAAGGRLFVVAHDSTNLTEGTGGPQDPSRLYTAQDVLADLPGPYEVVQAERMPRMVPSSDEHRGKADRVAWDAVVHVIKA